MDGYLNVMGTKQIETLKLITDAGFEIDAEIDLPENFAHEANEAVEMKSRDDLKAHLF